MTTIHILKLTGKKSGNNHGPTLRLWYQKQKILDECRVELNISKFTTWSAQQGTVWNAETQHSSKHFFTTQLISQ